MSGEEHWSRERVVWSVPDIAELLGLSRARVNQLVKSGDLPGFKIGSGRNTPWRVTQAALEEFTATRVSPRRSLERERRELESERRRLELDRLAVERSKAEVGDLLRRVYTVFVAACLRDGVRSSGVVGGG